MILKNRAYERKEPTKDAKIIIVYCEGKRREYNYFEYFREISTKLNIEPVELEHDEDNSPVGLLNKAINDIESDNPKYNLEESDEVWFVIDTDKWGVKIEELRRGCEDKNNWFVAQSNPCFELWLYFHMHKNIPDFEGKENSSNWKRYVNSNTFPGGFDSRKHPIFINDAIKNSKEIFCGDINKFGMTEVFLLAESFFPFVEKILNLVKLKNEI